VHAEVRTFADCARYVLTALMDLHSTPPHGTSEQFASLYTTSKPDVSTNAGKVALLNSTRKTLLSWRTTLKKFVQGHEDQFDLLLTLEEYCGCKGLFAGGAGSGDLYVPMFGNILWELYDMDIISENVFLEWEKQKALDDAEDQVCIPPMHSSLHRLSLYCSPPLSCSGMGNKVPIGQHCIAATVVIVWMQLVMDLCGAKSVVGFVCETTGAQLLGRIPVSSTVHSCSAFSVAAGEYCDYCGAGFLAACERLFGDSA
jgi:hypothetical protein